MASGATDSPGGLGGGERGVSEVMGVVFMVGITVVIAAVVGVFALSLGQQAMQAQPPVAINVESVDYESDEIVLEQDGGRTVQFSTIDITVRADNEIITFPASTGDATGFEPVDILTIDTWSPSVMVDGASVYGTATVGSLDIKEGDTVTVTIVDAQSGTILAESTVLA